MKVGLDVDVFLNISGPGGDVSIADSDFYLVLGVLVMTHDKYVAHGVMVDLRTMCAAAQPRWNHNMPTKKQCFSFLCYFSCRYA